MSSIDQHTHIWEQSSSRSFYNSPQHASFMADNGENIQLAHVDGSQGPVYIPISLPTVWTWFRNTKIPIPPVWGPRNSTYLGMLASGDSGLGVPATILQQVRDRSTRSAPKVLIIQPALLEQGITPDLDEWVDSIKQSGFSHSNTVSRLVELPESSDKILTSFNRIPVEVVLDSPDYSALLSSYDSKRRYDIRRAPRVGVTVEIDDVVSDDQAVEVYSSVMGLHKESWQRTGLGPHTLDYWTGFSRAMRTSGGHDLVVRAYYEGQIVSVVVVHIRGNSAFYQMNSSSISGQKVSANPYALHIALTSSSILGAKYFELGRYSDTDSDKTRQINDYKSQFGGFVVPVPNFVAKLKV